MLPGAHGTVFCRKDRCSVSRQRNFATAMLLSNSPAGEINTCNLVMVPVIRCTSGTLCVSGVLCVATKNFNRNWDGVHVCPSSYFILNLFWVQTKISVANLILFDT
jgi:hypothetical protein